MMDEEDYTCMNCGGEICSTCDGCTGDCHECSCKKNNDEDDEE